MSEMFEVIELGGIKTVTTKAACNHVYVVDVSGSMYRDLPKIRQHLKNIIGVVAAPEDTFSVIWFSGKKQCGVVFENVLVSDASTIAMMHNAIDRYLVPVCLTGFVDPIQLALTLNLDPTKVNSFIMMTDGYDNQFSKTEILNAAGMLPSKFASSTFIEYGYYADRDMLTQMATVSGGTLIFSDGYEKYEQALELTIKGVARVNNIEVNVNKRAKHAVYEYGGRINIVAVTDGKVSVPEDVERVHSIVPSDVLSKHLSEDHLFMILYYAAKTSNDLLVWNVLQVLGDVAMVEAYQNAFTKQEISEFEERVQNAVFDKSFRFVDGKSDNAVPNKNASTIVDLLEKLAESGAELVMDSPYWAYNKTGRSREKADTEEVLPRFIKSPMSRVSMRTLVFNSERPNVSINTAQHGTVELPKNDFGLKTVPSFIYRNYTIIRDGIKNVKELPVFVDAADWIKEYPHTVIEDHGTKLYVVFDLNKVPVINRAKVEAVSLDEVKTIIASMEYLKARQKVLNTAIKELGGSDSKIQGMIEKYGKEAADWLSSIGVRDYGFGAVGTTTAESTDEYMAVQLTYKIKGLSSLPSINAVKDKAAASKKLTVSDQLIAGELDLMKLSIDKLEEVKEQVVKQKRGFEAEMAKVVYTLILGRVWFGDEEAVETDITLAPGISSTLTLTKDRVAIKV